jgi:hypothetical protein
MLGAKHCKLSFSRVDERAHDRIRQLCARILETKDEAELGSLCLELRTEIQSRIDRIRHELQRSPFVSGQEERE